MQAKLIPPDLVYFVRRGEYNDELRFSLRSVAAFLPHERVWIVGHAPSWTRGVEVIPGNRRSTKWENVTDNLRIACERVPADAFVVMNDDFYVTRPFVELPPLVREGTLEDQVRRVRPGQWRDSLQATLDLLRAEGFPDPLSYELHVPVAMEREKLREAVALIRSVRPRRVPAQWRTVYGNLFGVMGATAKDSKSRRERPPSETGFESSDDPSFAYALRPRLRKLFPERGPYEAERPERPVPTSRRRRERPAARPLARGPQRVG